MEIAIALVALVVVAFLAYTYMRGPRGRGRAEPSARAGASPRRPEASLSNLNAGDVLVFWDGGDRIVTSVLRCREVVGGRTSTWQWAFVDDGRLIEAARDGVRLFIPLMVIYQGSADFERLVPPGGALGVFEERVRGGSVGRDPVHFDYDGKVYRVASTGTFAAAAEGEALGEQVWRDLSEDPSQNVYFELELAGTVPPGGNGHGARAARPAGASDPGAAEEILGVWTTHIWLGRGHKLSDEDVAALYSKR